MKSNNIMFLADRLPPLIGGMETHAGYFIDYFSNHPKYTLSTIITRNKIGQDCIKVEGELEPIDLNTFIKPSQIGFVFFNSGCWIEELEQIRYLFKNSRLIYRTGGNEILKAPLIKNNIPNHLLRQKYWAETLNNTIDVIITNSAFTEKRLREVGISCRLKRLVGGANDSIKKSTSLLVNLSPIIIFCAARFVPYKNHSLLISVIHELILRGHDIKLRLAGDGPLQNITKEQVQKAGISSCVTFLGAIDNQRTCYEIAQANVYMQLSCDFVTDVPGGRYIHSEGMGRSFLEALTIGTFIIAGNSGGLSEIIDDGHGLLVELDNLEKLVNQIEVVIKNPPKKKLPCERFSWQKVFNEYEKLFEQLNENTISNREI